MIRNLYAEAIINNHQSLILLIDYLVQVRKALTLDDDAEKLNYYLQEEFHKKMNEYLNEYNEAVKVVNVTNEVNVYQIRLFDTFFFVAAYTQKQAEAFFKEEYGQLHEIRIEVPELEVESKEGVHTLQQIITRTKTFPAILGKWELIT
jgi:hypothetical protein